MKRDLTQGKPIDHLLALTIPGILGALAIMLMNLADTWIIARLGADALAAVSFTFPVVMIVTSLAFGISTASLSLITRAIGSEQGELTEAYCTHTLLIALGFGVLFALVGLATINPLFTLLQAPKHLLPLIHDYMSLWYFSSVFIILTLVANAIIRASGNTRFPSLVLVGIAVLNLILMPLLVYGPFGLPRLELQGAAIASGSAFCAGFLIVIHYLKTKLQWINITIVSQDAGKYWKEILSIAIPNTANSMIAPVTVAITLGFIAQYGSDAVAGYGVASRVSALGLITFAALSTTLALFAGQHWGARKMERMDSALKIGFRFAIFWGLLLAIIFWLFATPIVSLFTDQPLAIESATHYLYIIPISFAFLSIIMISSAISNGLGEPLPALFFTATRLLLLYLPLVWVLSKLFALDGIYVATAVSNICVGIIAFYWIKQKAHNGRTAREKLQNRQSAWDERYNTSEYLFGTEANTFLKEHVDSLPVGRTLSIGEGEGRNAVFLASQGHSVTALDASEVALAKATKLASQNQLSINTVHTDLNRYQAEPNHWDLIVSIFCHLPEAMRKRIYPVLVNSLKPGGYLILEAYTPEQLAFKTGGPPTIAVLANLNTLKKELKGLEFIHTAEVYRELKEGNGHNGHSAVVQIIARRPSK